MTTFGRQLEQAAKAVGTVIGAIIGFFLRLRAVIRALQDATDWYRQFTGHPQSKKSLLLTYAIGALVVVLAIIPSIFSLVAIPLFFGYLIRESGIMLHSEDDRTLLQAPWRRDRPAFRDLFDLTIDGLKAGVLPVLYVALVGFVWYNSAGVIDSATDDLAGATVLAVGPAALVGFIGWLALPAFMTRYADHGRLGEAVAEPRLFAKDVILDGQYLAQFAIGTGAVLLAVAINAGIYVWLSPLLVVSIGLPLVFVLVLQAFDHFAIGYKRAVGVQAVETEGKVPELAENSYLVPFHEEAFATPDRDRSILALGETGSGKTEAIKLLAYQFQTDDRDPFVVFDYKEDFREFFGQKAIADGGVATAEDSGEFAEPAPELGPDRPDDLIILSLEGSTDYWNIFEEAESEADLEEIGRSLFATAESSSSDPFFAGAARQVFVAILKLMYREPHWQEPTNRDLLTFFENQTLKDIAELLEQHADLSGAAVNIDPGTPRRSGSVYGHLQARVNEVFKGDFAKHGDFSIREYMQNPDGRTLLFDFPTHHGDSIKPIFRVLIDWSISHGLNDDSREAYFLLDEFATIPGLERIERLVNAGRARGAYGILGLQAKTQLYSTYGRSEGEAILSGLAQEVLLRPGDEPTVEHIRARLGRNQRIQATQGPTDRITRLLTGRESEYNQYSIQEEYPISEAELQQFQAGEAIVLEPEGWRHGRLFMLDDELNEAAAEELKEEWDEDDEETKPTIRDLLDYVHGTTIVEPTTPAEPDESVGDERGSSTRDESDESPSEWSDSSDR